MPNYVRVRDQLGHRYSVQEGEYAANPDAYELLDEPAADRTGTPLPPEPAPKPKPKKAPKSAPKKGSLSSHNTGHEATENKES